MYRVGGWGEGGGAGVGQEGGWTETRKDAMLVVVLWEYFAE